MLFRLIVMLILFPFSAAQADVIGIYAGIGYWAYDLGGDAISDISLDDDFNISSANGVHIYLALEHPIPLLPNVKFAYTSISDRSTSALTTGFAFKGVPFLLGQSVDTEIDLTHMDITLYYELVDIGFDLDLGVTGRLMSGEVSIGPIRENVNVVVPMAYAHAKVGFLFTGLYVGGLINAGSDIVDYQLKIGWETENFIFPEFGIEVGYRSFSVDANEGDFDVDMDVVTDGIFLNLTAHF